MKKILAVTLLAATVGFFGIQQASAQRGMMGGGSGPVDCWRANQQQAQVMDEETQKTRDAFFAATTDLRKEMFSKSAEMRAVMHSENPDEKKASVLAGEMFDLRTQLQAKAEETGWKGGFGGAGYGCNGHGKGGYGMGAGYGCDGPGDCGKRSGGCRKN